MSQTRLVAILTLLLATALAFGQDSPDAVKAVYREIHRAVSGDRLRQDYQQITAFGSRLTGSVAEAKTFDYVQRQLVALGGKNPRRRTYEVTVPDPASTATLTIGGSNTTLFPLWPNLVRSSTCDVY